MAITVSLWVVSGIALALTAWRAAPSSFPAGELSCVIAGMGGAFVGGELFVVLGGPVHATPDLLSVLGALAGGLVCLDLITQAAAAQTALPQTRAVTLWLAMVLWSPILLAVAVGAAFTRAAESALVGVAATAANLLFIVLWHERYLPRTRRTR